MDTRFDILPMTSSVEKLKTKLGRLSSDPWRTAETDPLIMFQVSLFTACPTGGGLPGTPLCNDNHSSSEFQSESMAFLSLLYMFKCPSFY